MFGLPGADTSNTRSLNVVITGSTKGIGLGLAVKFLSLGDNVVICSRTASAVDDTVAKLQAEYPKCKVFGTTVDIALFDSVRELGAFAKDKFGDIDVWINNAGVSQHHKTILRDTPVDVVKQIVDINVLGTLYGDMVAMQVMERQKRMGHVFNMEGAGSNGMTTPFFATYGFSKAGYVQLLGSLKKEQKSNNVGVHNLSPGMVMTDLLMSPSVLEASTLKIFNILAERVGTVANFLVPQIRGAVKKGKSGYKIRYLTTMGVIWRFLTAPFRINRLLVVDAKSGTATDKESGKVYKLNGTKEAPATDSAHQQQNQVSVE